MNIARPARLAVLSCSMVLLSACATFRIADRDLDSASRQIATGDMTLTAADDSGVPKGGHHAAG